MSKSKSRRIDTLSVCIVLLALVVAGSIYFFRKPHEQGEAPLFAAVQANSGQDVEKLLKSGADVNVRRKLDAATPLIVAVNTDIAMTKRLLEQGANVNAADVDGDTALLKVMETFQMNLLQGNYMPVTRVRSDPAKYFALIQLLLDNHADINVENKSGVTPLIRAVQMRRLDVVDFLLKAGADPNKNTAAGVRSSSIEGGNALCYAAEYGQVEILSRLLKAGGKVNVRNIKGATPLLIAARWGQAECVRFLLEKGANPYARTVYGDSSLMFAVRTLTGAQLECVRLLLARRATINEKNDEGDTPLILAAQYGTTDTVREVLQYGAEVNYRRNGNIKPLAFAVGRGVSTNAGKSASLISMSAREPKADRPLNGLLYFSLAGDSALSYAAMFDRADVIELLLKKGAALNVQNSRGQTPLHIAAAHGCVAAAKALLQHGADATLRTKNGETALRLAEKSNNPLVITLLQSP